MSGEYRTIVADPPWHYEAVPCAPDNRGGPNPVRGKVIRRPWPYPTLSVAGICALPVEDLAERDSRLFLWTTSAYLGDAFSVVESWGFKYVQTVVWRKTGNPAPFGGSVAPNHAEFMLVGKRGKPERLMRWPSSVVEVAAPQCNEHSRKPEVFLDLIEQVSPGPYVELFARRNRLGWDTWGNEALEHVAL